MSVMKNTPPNSQNLETYYDANSDTTKSRILVGTGQELIQYQQQTAIRIWYNNLAVDYEPHWHSALEIIMTVENDYDAVVADVPYHIPLGGIMMIPPGEIHSLTAPETGSRFVYLFDLAPFSRFQGFSGILPLLSQPLLITRENYPAIYEDICNILIEIRNEYFSRNEFSELTICSHLLNLFVKLGANRLESINLFSNIRVYKQKEYIQKFNSVMDYIDSHYMDVLNLEDIASSIGFSKYHFSRLFKQYTGYTFCAYISRRRIKVAEELLEQPDLSITEIALQSGFPSISTFNRLFKQQKGCTPSEYREKNNYYKRTN